jgi:hypothetical protein
MAEKKYPVVRIEWIDAETDNSWRDLEEIAKEEVGKPVTTIGFLVRKPSKRFPMYMVASTVSFGDYMLHNAIIKIPKHWVQSVVELNLTEKKNDNQSKDPKDNPPV